MMSNIHSLLQLMATLALHGVTTVRKAGPRNILRRHRTTPVLLSIRVVVIKKHALPISQATATGLPDYPKGKLSSRDRRSSCCPYLISKLLLFFFFFAPHRRSPELDLWSLLGSVTEGLVSRLGISWLKLASVQRSVLAWPVVFF